MKKLFSTILVLGLLFSGNANANDIKKLNKELLEIEARLDLCLDTKNKDICIKFMTDNPLLLEIFGNEDFAKLLSTSKCQIDDLHQMQFQSRLTKMIWQQTKRYGAAQQNCLANNFHKQFCLDATQPCHQT